MSDEIARRLASRHLRDSLKESLANTLFEAEGDEDEEETNYELDDIDTEEEDSEMDDPQQSEEPGEDRETNNTTRTSGARHSSPPAAHDEEKPAPAPKPFTTATAENPNPLDNVYAMNHKLGDEIAMIYSNGSKTELEGVIEGYDKEGFYRVRWKDGRTTNGLTDIAIAELVGAPVKESVCVCGHKNFVEEDGKIICDNCGRIKEGADLLSEKPKEKKRIIRATPKDVSTAVRPDIAESIKTALKDIRRNK